MILSTLFPQASHLTGFSATHTVLTGLAMIGLGATTTVFAADRGIPDGFVSKTVVTQGVQVHCVVGGQGSAVVLIHGYPETWYEWRKVMPLLAKNHLVVAVDVPGFGDSDLLRSGYDKKTLGAYVHGAVQSLGISKCALVGHDWGGPIAFAYAAQFPGEVEKLVLVEGAPFGPWMKSTNPFWFFDFLRIPGYAEKVLDGREKEFLSYFYHNDHFHRVPGVFDEETVNHYTRAYSRPGRMKASYELYRTIDQDVKDNAIFVKEPLSVPILAIGAEAGAGAVVSESSRHVASNVASMVFKDTGHFIPEERPEAFTEAVETFLAGQKPAEVWKP